MNKVLNYKFVILICVSFILSSYLSFNYIKKYDNYSEYKAGKHPMLKVAVENHYLEASKVVKVLKKVSVSSNKKNLSDEFLPGKVLGLYFFLVGEDLYEGEFIKIDNGKFLYLVLKSFLYYLIVFILYKKIIKIFPKNICFFIILFLCLSPDIFQYHSSFWNESLFFSFQIILLFLLIEFKKSFLHNFFLGISTCSLYLISQEYFFYIFIILLYYLFISFNRKYFLYKSMLSFIIGYFMLFFSVSYVNQAKTGTYTDGLSGLKTAPYIYIVPQTLSNVKNKDLSLIIDELKNEDMIWAKKNNLNIIKTNNLILKFDDNNFKVLNKYHNYIFLKSIKIILKNYPTIISMYFKKSFHLVTLNPFYIKYFYEYDGKGEFLKTETHQKNIPIRITYSIIFYLFILIGFFKSVKNMKPELIFILTISILYIFLVMTLLASPRYFTPALIFMSPFFGFFFKKK